MFAIVKLLAAKSSSASASRYTLRLFGSSALQFQSSSDSTSFNNTKTTKNDTTTGDAFAAAADATDKKQSKESEDADLEASIPEAEEALERARLFREQVESRRDVSRLKRTTLKEKLKHEMPTFEEKFARKIINEQSIYRKAYAKFGKASNIEPGVIWPHKIEQNKIISEEKEYELELKHKIELVSKRKAEKIEAFKKLYACAFAHFLDFFCYDFSIVLLFIHCLSLNQIELLYVSSEKETDEALKKMPKQIESYFQRVHKREAQEKEREAKKREVLEKAREFFGYEVDLRDPK
jgi:hypothetical protein